MNAAQAKSEPTVRLDVTIISADECQGQFSIALFGSQRQETIIHWSPAEPELQTETVRFSLSGTRFVESVEELDGDTWRTLESYELTEHLIGRLLTGEPAHDAAADLISTL
jgi:hypothetical protein